MASISILVLITARRLDGGAGQHGILEVLAEYPIVAAEVASILEIGRDAHDVERALRLLRRECDE